MHVTTINEQVKPWIWKRARGGIWELLEEEKEGEMKDLQYNFKKKKHKKSFNYFWHLVAFKVFPIL